MIKLTEERVTEVLHYLEEDLPSCLYIHGDIVRYGLNDPNITVWYSEKDGKLNAVVMKYFTGSHVYSKDLDYDLDEVVAKLREIKPDRISSQRPIVEALAPILAEDYDAEYGSVFKLSKFRNLKPTVEIERATVEDAEAIADLMMTHEMYSSSYQKEELTAELKDRLGRGIGRSYIIRDGDRIAVHDSVMIETDTYAVEGLLLLHEDYKNTWYGAFMDSYMVNDLGKEGKDLYCMIAEGRRMESFIRFGNEVAAKYGKLCLKQ